MKSTFSGLTNLQQRIITGLIGAFIIGGGLLFAEWSYLIINLGISLIGLNEFYQLCIKSGHKVSVGLGIGLAIALQAATYLVLKSMVNPLLFSVGFPLILSIFLHKLFDKNERNPMMSLGLTFLGIIYVVLPFCLVHGVAVHAGFRVVFGLVGLVWINDMFAYFAGRAFGKTKLYPRISPNKTWEGFVGGGMATMIVAGLLSTTLDQLSLMQWLTLGFLIPPFATLGDLVESMIKRSLEIKDSSKLMPGHGGMLDRIDSLLFVFPIATALILVWLSLDVL